VTRDGKSIVTPCMGSLRSTHHMKCVPWHSSRSVGHVTYMPCDIGSLDFHMKI